MRETLWRRLAPVAGFTLLTAAGAQLYWSAGLSPAPISLALLAVLLTGAMLPKKAALAAQVLYLVLVVAGVPVYSAFLGGRQVITGMTGGYLIAYPLVAVLVALAVERWGHGLHVCFLAMAGALIPYFLFAFILLWVVSGMGPAAAFAASVKPHLLPSLGWAMVGALGVRVWGYLRWRRRRKRTRRS